MKMKKITGIIIALLLMFNVFAQDELNIKDKTWSTQVGFGTRRNINLLEISKEFNLNDKSSFYITSGGLLSALGVGYSFSNNYNKDGICFSTGIGFAGLYYKSPQDTTKDEGLPVLKTFNTSLLYQWRIGKQSFLSLGLMSGIYQVYFGEKQTNKIYTGEYILPVIAYDYRF